MSWARWKAGKTLDAHVPVVHRAIIETIEEAARRACDCGEIPHVNCPAGNVLAMLEDK